MTLLRPPKPKEEPAAQIMADVLTGRVTYTDGIRLEITCGPTVTGASPDGAPSPFCVQL